MNDLAMTIEVIIPTLNDGATLRRAVHSALDQSEIEPPSIIVVDNGSTDHSVDDLRALNDNHVRVIQCEERGAWAARNAGLSLASSPVIAFLDADDTWVPTHLSTAMSALENRPVPALYSAPARAIDEAGHVAWVSQPGRIGNPWGAKLLGRNRIVTSGVVINGAPFSARFPSRPSEDIGLWIRLFLEGFDLVRGTRPTVDYTISAKRYPHHLNFKSEWATYKELVAAQAVSRTDCTLASLALSAGHFRTRLRARAVRLSRRSARLNRPISNAEPPTS